MIELENINKTFRVRKRQAGFNSALKSFFSRDYEVINALIDVSFTVNDGEMVGYIGPNGAGKSTTIKIMCGILTPTLGSCIINGRVPWNDRVNHVGEIGVVFGQRSQLWWDVPIIDSFELIRDIYRIDQKSYKDNLNELTELLDLKEIVKTPARSLSLGERMRCEIVASLLHSPKTLFLDEPTIGLDAVSKIAVRSFVKKINKERRTTVILTTHDMQDIEALTERIILIGKGRILLDDTLVELKKHVSVNKKLIISHLGDTLKIIKGMVLSEVKEGRLIVELDTSIVSVSEAISYFTTQTQLQDISVIDPSAEEMVAKLYKEYKI